MALSLQVNEIHRDVSFPSMLVKDSYGCEVFCRVAALELLQSEDTGVVSFGDVVHVLYSTEEILGSWMIPSLNLYLLQLSEGTFGCDVLL